MGCKKTELKYTWYTILSGITDPVLSLSAMREAAGMPMKYPGLEVEKLYEFLLSPLPDKAFKPEKSRTLWNPIFNYAVDRLNHRKCERGTLKFFEGIVKGLFAEGRKLCV